MRDARAQTAAGRPDDRRRRRTAALATDEATSWDRALAAASPDDAAARRRAAMAAASSSTPRARPASRRARTAAWKKTGFESVADMILQVGMRADDRHLVVCPLYHSAAPAFVAIMMSLGATVVLMNHFDPEGALDIIQRERITCTLMVPTMLIRMTNLPAEIARRSTTPRSLRWVMSGAAPLTTEAARRFMDAVRPGAVELLRRDRDRPRHARRARRSRRAPRHDRQARCAATRSACSTTTATRSRPARSASSTRATRR